MRTLARSSPVEELAREAALADARLAVDRERGARAGRGRPGRTCSRAARAPPRARRAARAGRAAVRRPLGADRRRQARSGASRPLSSSGPASSTTRLPAASRYAVGPTGSRPGSAACWSRAATLTASPVAKVESPSSTTTSPASIPIRACELELVDRLAHRERRAHGPLGVVLVRLRDTEGGQDGVAGELLDDAAVLVDAARDACRRSRSRDAARPPDRRR